MPTGNSYIDLLTSAGTNVSYSFPFEALTESSVVVSLDGNTLINDTDYTLDLPTKQIVLIGTYAANRTLRISRNTSQTTLVNFTDGAGLKASDLNTMNKQMLYLSQEANDVGGNHLSKNIDGKYDAGSKVITNVATAVNVTDATNKSYVDGIVSTIASYGSSTALTSWTFSGTGSQTAFTLGSAPPSYSLLSNSYIVFVNSVLVLDNAYSITLTSGSYKIVFSTAPSSGTNNVYVRSIGYAKDVINNALTANTLSTSRTFSISGDVTTTTPQSFNGSSNVVIPITLNTTGVTPSTYTNASITVDSKGRITSANNGTAATVFSTSANGLVPQSSSTNLTKFLRGDAQWAAPITNGVNGMKTFTTSGTFTPSVDAAGYTKFKVTVIGGGGGAFYGDSGAYEDFNSKGGTGASGTVIVVPVDLSTGITVTVGDAGTSSTSYYSATNGGNSSFGAYLTAGGGTRAVRATPGISGSLSGDLVSNASPASAYVASAPPAPSNQAYSMRFYGAGAVRSINSPLTYGVILAGSGLVIVEW